MDWLQICKEFGPYLGLIFFFIWRDSKREENLQAQLQEAHKFIVKELITLVKSTSEALSNERKPDSEPTDTPNDL